MSQEAIDAQVRCLNLVNRGELSDEVLHSLFTPDLKLQNPATGVTDGSYEGPAAVREWIGDFIEAFGQGARVEIDKIIVDGDDFVMTRQRCIGEGIRSGAPLELRWMNVTWLRDGRICRMAGYANRHEAFKAVGLEE